MMPRKPNFFIIGAPKSGTTAMSDYLRSHPEVFVSDPKEPCFFSKDVVPSNYRSINEYLDLFAHATSQHSVVAEASTQYIHSKHAVEKIREFQPDAKILVMLRRPADLVYAYHGHLVKQGYELEKNFEKAWELQSMRATGKALSEEVKYRRGALHYKWIGSLGSQVENVLRIFPEDQVHFTFFEDFVADPGSEYRSLLAFLGLPDDGRKVFPRINEATAYRWLWLGQFPRRLRRHIAGPLRALHRTTGLRGTGLLKMLDRFNVESRSRPPLHPEFRRHLDAVFSDEVVLLEKLVGRDLLSWRCESPENSKL